MNADRARAALARLHQLPTIPRGERPRPDRLGPGWALLFAVGWPVVTALNIAVEPAPADPEAAAPLWAGLLYLAFLAALIGTVAASVRRLPAAAAWSTGVGVAAMGLTLACPSSAHHTAIGAWWFTQLALTGGMLAVSGWRLRRR